MWWSARQLARYLDTLSQQWSERMSVRHLNHFFAPGAVAVIGASKRPGSVGATVLANLASGGFEGPIWPVNPKYRDIEGLPAWRDVADLPHAPELAVICTPAPTVPGIIAVLGAAAPVAHPRTELRRPAGAGTGPERQFRAGGRAAGAARLRRAVGRPGRYPWRNSSARTAASGAEPRIGLLQDPAHHPRQVVRIT
jgi:hypothetical protein